MSDDIDKLAAEMQNIRPSKTSRQSGMDAAMTAFDMEFASEMTQQTAEQVTQQTTDNIEKNIINQKISHPAQGLTTAPRPTGQTTHEMRVLTLGRDIMTSFNKIFTPKMAMMGGSCMAAILASFIYFQTDTNSSFPINAAGSQTVAVADNTPSNTVVIDRRVVQTPASTQERITPAVTKQETRRVEKEDGTFETVSETVVITGSRITQITTPPTYETVRETVEVQTDGSTQIVTSETLPSPNTPKRQNGITSITDLFDDVRKDAIASGSDSNSRQAEFRSRSQERPTVSEANLKPRIIINDRNGKEVLVTREGAIPAYRLAQSPNTSGNQFENYEPNPVTAVENTPVSTFSIDVDTASYSFLRASLNRGQLPPPGAIRLEEMINYFPYDYEAPRSADEPFKANVTVTPTPWNPDTKLMHIGIKGYVPPADERPRSNIVLLIDTSGSMNAPDKLPLLVNSFKLLLNTLDEDDTVSIVTYAGAAGTVLEPTPASDKAKINAALKRLRAGGSTAGAAGLELAYQKAQESFDDEGVNRVILATDGDFNVGFSSHEQMKEFITKKRETGIFLSVLGFGQGNYNDQLMQSLAQNGNGIAAYIDTLSEANKVLANETGSTLITIAKDVKIQVEFNPETVSEYRLIGYETRALKREDFNNDKVDAGDIGAGHSVTAIYEVTPVNSPAKVFDKLRYAADKITPKASASSELAFVKIRHKLPNADTSTLQTFPIGPKQERNLKRANDDMRFAVAVAAVGQKLRGDTQLSGFSYDEAIKLASNAKGEDDNGYRSEFIQLVRLAQSLQEADVNLRRR